MQKVEIQFTDITDKYQYDRGLIVIVNRYQNKRHDKTMGVPMLERVTIVPPEGKFRVR